MKKILSLILFTGIAMAVNAQNADKIVPFPETCLSAAEKIEVKGESAIFIPIMNCKIVEYRFIVSDQSGKIIFQTEDANEPWKLTDKTAAGVYNWVVMGEMVSAKFGLQTRGQVEVSQGEK